MSLRELARDETSAWVYTNSDSFVKESVKRRRTYEGTLIKVRKVPSRRNVDVNVIRCNWQEYLIF